MYFLLFKNYRVELSKKSNVFVSFILILLGFAQNLTNAPGSVLSDKTTRTHETNARSSCDDCVRLNGCSEVSLIEDTQEHAQTSPGKFRHSVTYDTSVVNSVRTLFDQAPHKYIT